jgi:5-methylcytosine-specific restriction endonuclease McrA
METVKNKYCGSCKKSRPIIEFYSSGRYCKECVRAKNKEYRFLHRNKLLEYDINRYYKNQEMKKEERRKYRNKHPDKVNLTNRKYYASHSEYREQAMERWRKRRIVELNAPGDGFTLKQWKELKSEYGHRCAYCNQVKPLQQDHVIPLSKGGRHESNNIVPACKSCNGSKRDTPLLIWMLQKRKDDLHSDLR